jgi:hypothetical protein
MNILDNEVDVERVKGFADSLVNAGYDARIEFHRKTLASLDITTVKKLLGFFTELRANLEVQIDEMVTAYYKNNPYISDEHRYILPQPSSTREE